MSADGEPDPTSSPINDPRGDPPAQNSSSSDDADHGSSSPDDAAQNSSSSDDTDQNFDVAGEQGPLVVNQEDVDEAIKEANSAREVDWGHGRSEPDAGGGFLNDAIIGAGAGLAEGVVVDIVENVGVDVLQVVGDALKDEVVAQVVARVPPLSMTSDQGPQGPAAEDHSTPPENAPQGSNSPDDTKDSNVPTDTTPQGSAAPAGSSAGADVDIPVFRQTDIDDAFRNLPPPSDSDDTPAIQNSSPAPDEDAQNSCPSPDDVPNASPVPETDDGPAPYDPIFDEPGVISDY
jgi:hypothetical protein